MYVLDDPKSSGMYGKDGDMKLMMQPFI